MLDLAHASHYPYYTNPGGYDGHHRNDSPQAQADGIRDDYAALRGRQHPSTHHRARHSAFVPRVHLMDVVEGWTA